jgi:hypothetical protein
MRQSLTFAAYLIYLPVVISLTWYVARTLFKNARVFMLEIFHGRAEMADSTNKLFETGFYLLNVGFALVIMEIAGEVYTGQSMLEVLSAKIGGFSIYLGLMLFINLYFFFRGRRVSKERSAARIMLPAGPGATPSAEA